MAATNIKVNPPTQLPTTGVTPISFKVWKSSLIVYLQQRVAYQRFMPGEAYATWTSADNNPDRIAALDANDQPPADGGQNQVQIQAAVDARLQDRRLELETMLSQIATLCSTSDYDDIMTYSTGLTWIWQHLEQNYDIQKKGVHFMKLGKITFDKTNGESQVAFYKRMRSHFTDNLRQTGDTIQWKDNHVLTENEKLSPILECTIVFLALKEIDPCLPDYVELVYGHQMTQNTTIMEMQPAIFQAIPRLLSEIEVKEAGMNSMMYEEDDDTVDLNAAGAYGGRGRRGNFRGRPQQRGRPLKQRGRPPSQCPTVRVQQPCEGRMQAVP